MTIITMTLVKAPIAVPTALVSRPTEPSSWRRDSASALGHQAERGGEFHAAGRTAR